MNTDHCQLRLGPNGVEQYSVNEAKQALLAELQSDLLKTSGLVRDANDSQVQATRDAAKVEIGKLNRNRRTKLRELRDLRFHSARDSDEQEDVRNDPRSRKWISVTRDAMEPHHWERKGNPAQMLSRLHDGKHYPCFDQRVSDAGVDHERFIDEATKLAARGLISELPNFESDESMMQFMGKVHDMAQEEGVRTYKGETRTNRVVDAAPGLYLFSELLKRTEILVEEDFTELWARRIFPIRNLNTYLPQWYFERIDDRTVLPWNVDLERLPSDAQRGSENRDSELRNLMFYMHAASWSKLELMRYAEAQANGAPRLALDRRRIDAAIRMMNLKEDLITFFGDNDTNIFGLYTAQAKTGIERIASTVYGGPFGTDNGEADRRLLTGPVKQIIENTEQILAPDTIMVGTRTWLYINDILYGTVDSNATANRTIMEQAMETLRRFGIKDILWVPEVGYSAQQSTRLRARGLSQAEADRYAGGENGEQTMVVCKRDAGVGEMIVAKDRTMYPAAETRTDRVETRMLQGSGGLAVYKPEGYKIIRDVGPNPPAP